MALFNMLLLLYCTTANAGNGDSILRYGVSDTLSLLQDGYFKRGLVLEGTNSGAAGRDRFIFPYGGDGSQVQWGLAEWGSRFKLADTKRSVRGKEMIYAAKGKKIAFEQPAGSYRITMDVTASAEYAASRKEGEGWPHMLLGQTFTEKPYLKDLEGLILKFSGRLTKAALRMKKGEFDPALHTAQFQLFITVQDLDPDSPSKGDFFWFGIPFYDYRYKDIKMFAAQDQGKEDASGKFIYCMGSTDFMKGSFHSGAWITVDKDIYPMIKNAVTLAKQRGYLTGSSFENLQLSSMNLGWEVPGTLDVGFEFRNFDLLKVIRN